MPLEMLVFRALFDNKEYRAISANSDRYVEKLQNFMEPTPEKSIWGLNGSSPCSCDERINGEGAVSRVRDLFTR